MNGLDQRQGYSIRPRPGHTAHRRIAKTSRILWRQRECTRIYKHRVLSDATLSFTGFTSRSPVAPTATSVAQELGLSARSFQRRLAEERTSFRSLVRDQRRTLAESLIKDRSATLTAVAHTIGYAETAVLSPAFKVWTGASPRAFIRRERHASAANR